MYIIFMSLLYTSPHTKLIITQKESACKHFLFIISCHLTVPCLFRIMLVCVNTSHRNAHCTISFLKPQVLVCFSFKISISLSEYPSSQRSFLHPEAGTESLLVWMLPDRQIHPPYKSDCCRTFHLPSAHFGAVQHPWSL